MQTIVESLRKLNINTYNALKNLVDGESYRQIYIFPNEFS